MSVRVWVSHPIFPRQDLKGFDGDSGSSASYKALMSGVVKVGLTFSRSLSVHPKAEKTERT